MKNHLPDFIIRHHRIENPDSSKWNLTQLALESGTRIKTSSLNLNTKKKLERLVLKHHQIDIIKSIKDHAEALLDTGISVKGVSISIGHVKRLFRYLDENRIRFDTVDNIRKALFEYSEYEFTRANLNLIKHQTAYGSVSSILLFINSIFEDLNFEIKHTRLKTQKKSQRALSREAEKVMLVDARELAKFCFDLAENFEPLSLTSGYLPIIVNANNKQVNLTPARKYPTNVGADFTQTEAYLAFNLRVAAEVMIFLSMTIQNQAQVYNLKRVAFHYKPLGENYEIRDYKARRGGEVLFKIPKPYKVHFEKYLAFINEYASDSEFLFPYLKKYSGFKKRTDVETSKLQRFCSRYKIPWIKPSSFRKIGENIIMRLASDEKTASDYANHAVATFRQSYEFPSLQRAMIEVARFWNKNDPLNNGGSTVSLFSSPCNGIPMPIEDATIKLPKPDCITPTGCIGCKHYRDDDSFDYVWGLHSFKFLKIIESSSQRTTEEKPSNIAINWVNLKINWFKNSEKIIHQEWVEEAAMRVEESDYHPSWSRKIENYER